MLVIYILMIVGGIALVALRIKNRKLRQAHYARINAALQQNNRKIERLRSDWIRIREVDGE